MLYVLQFSLQLIWELYYTVYLGKNVNNTNIVLLHFLFSRGP